MLAGDLRRKQDRAIGADEQRVAVGCSLRDHLAADQPAGAGLVLDHDRLAELLLQLVGDDARRAIDIAAGRIRDHETHRALWPVLRGGRQREHAEGGSEQEGFAHLVSS
jgi:hypothetical protein